MLTGAMAYRVRLLLRCAKKGGNVNNSLLKSPFEYLNLWERDFLITADVTMFRENLKTMLRSNGMSRPCSVVQIDDA